MLSVCSLFAERQRSDLALRRASASKRSAALVVEDAITTGKSIKETASLVLALGGDGGGLCLHRRAWRFPRAFSASLPLSAASTGFSGTECVPVQEGVLSTNLEVAQKRCDHAATWAVAEDF